MATTSDFFPGMIIRMDGELWTIIEFQHVNPGNWRAFVRVRLKGLKSGKVVDTRLRAGITVDAVRVETREYQYLYHDGTGYVFMEKDTYEQISVPEEALGGGRQFLKDNEFVTIVFDGTDIINVQMPIAVVLKVTDTVPGVRGDSATAAKKPATVETGATVNVPLFVNEGDYVKIDTRTGEYLERAKG